MASIQLLQLDPETERALMEHSDYLESMKTDDWDRLASVVLEVVGDSLEGRLGESTVLHWGGYLAVDVETKSVVGSCAFKAAPNDDGLVEIAYFTYPTCEGRGYATAMASELIALGSASAEVKMIIAHTLPEKSASTRVLEKNGLECVGEVTDPEDGQVWRWEHPGSA